MSTTSFIKKLNHLSLSSTPLKPYTSRSSFPESYSSSFPVFSLHPSISKSDVTQVIKSINEQACTELGFSHAELGEMCLVAALPTPWDLSSMEAGEVAQWYLESFDKGFVDEMEDGSKGDEDPKFYPLAFIGVDNADWNEKGVGVVLVYFDVLGQGSGDSKEGVMVKACRLDAEKMGAAVVSLRQGDDDIDNVKRHCAVDEDTST